MLNNKGKFMFRYILILFTLIHLNFGGLFALDAKIDEKAPDFTLIDSHGNVLKLSDYSGKYIVLEWVNYDCPFVKKHYNSNNMQNLQKKFMSKGVVWLSICSSTQGKQGNFDDKEINKRIKDQKADITAYLKDEDGSVGHSYGAKTTPNMFIIDPSFVLRYAGAIDDIASADQDDIHGSVNYVDKAMTELLAGNPVETKISKPYGCSVKYK